MTMDEKLAALADGTLAPKRRDDVVRRVGADPELAAAVARQRAALAAIAGTAREPASDALRASVSGMASHAAAARRWRVRRPLALAGAFTAALAIAAVVVVGGEPAGPSVAQAARVALAPAMQHGDAARTATVDGIAYPYWADSTGWRAVGERRDVLDGRTIHTVFYTRAGQRIGYAIAAGTALSLDGGRTVTRNGIRMRVLRTGDATIVTWLRAGHTCILAARHLDPDVLLELAARPA